MRTPLTRLAVAALSVAVLLPATASALSERTKDDYTAAYYPAKKRCGEKPGPHLRKVPGEPSAARYHAWTKKLLGMCRSLPKVVAHAKPEQVAPKRAPAQGGGAGGDLASIRACESGGNYSTNTGNGYYGAYQFDQSTWQAAGGTGMPHTASPAEQDRVAANWIAKGHRGAWPNC